MNVMETLLPASLLAAALVAFAQSSVTLYGITDVGVEYVNHVPNASKP